MGKPDHLTCLLRNPYQVKKQQLEPNVEQQTGSNLEEEYDKTMLSPCLFNLYAEYWMNHKLKSRLPGEITSDMQMIPF